MTLYMNVAVSVLSSPDQGSRSLGDYGELNTYMPAQPFNEKNKCGWRLGPGQNLETEVKVKLALGLIVFPGC